jgi:transposase
MVYRRIRSGQKYIAARLHERGRDSIEDIAEVCDMSCDTVYRSIHLYQHTGSIGKQKSLSQRCPRVMNRADVAYMIALVAAQPTIYLAEIQEQLLKIRNLDVSISTIRRTLLRNGVTCKALDRTAREQDALRRMKYRLHMSQYKCGQLVFLDETAVDKRTYFRLRGRAPRGSRAVAPAPFVCGDRYSLLPAMSVDGIFATHVVKGSFNRTKFIKFLKNDVVRVLSKLGPFLINFSYPIALLILVQGASL